MTNFTYSIKKIFALIIAALLSISVGSSSAKPGVKDSENCKSVINVVSDVHVEGNNMTTYKNYGKVLKGLDQSKADVNIFMGDNTMNGQDAESFLFFGALARQKLGGETIVLCGNHDVGFEKSHGDYDALYKQYTDYCNVVANAPVDGVNFYRVINGCYFIVINPSERCLNELPLNDEIFTFLDETLAKAKADGMPSFILSHWPNTSNADHGESFRKIIRNYDNVYFVSGHTHEAPQKFWTFGKWYGINEINIPRCTESYPDMGAGWGIRIEIYENEIIGRVFNFITGEYNDALEYTFTLA